MLEADLEAVGVGFGAEAVGGHARAAVVEAAALGGPQQDSERAVGRGGHGGIVGVGWGGG